jgi:hypothetical protein
MAARAAWATSLLDAASTEMKAAGEVPGKRGVPQNILSRSIGRVLEWQAEPALDRIHRHSGSGKQAGEKEVAE